MSIVEILNEPSYSFKSANNPRSYPFKLNLTAEAERPSSIHGVLIDGTPAAIFGAGGGATGVHEHSLLSLGDVHYLAVGPFVVSFTSAPFQFRWSQKVDFATCFGVYLHEPSGALISHGELELCRFNQAGEVVWVAGGADIFIGSIEILSEHVRVTDFNGRVYCFSYESGRARV